MASVVDVFCGAGGLTHGFVRQGFKVVAGIDVDAACKYPYETNNNARFIHKSLSELRPDEVEELFVPGKPKILIGCAPCQPFSSYTYKLQYSDKWQLIDDFADLIVAIKPDIFSMENVPALVRYKGGEVFEQFIRALQPVYGDDIWWRVIHTADYGVPQLRKRLVVLGSRFGPISLMEQTHSSNEYVSVHETVGHLPEVAAGDVCGSDSLHCAQGLSPLNMRRIQQSKPGGSWRDWDEELLAPCHRKASGRTYSTVYGRMQHDKPAPTITTQAYSYGTGRFGHPTQDRALTLREMALLQTFPEDYEFHCPKADEVTFKRIGKLMGNAVPVLLAERIAESIERHLEGHGHSK